MGSLGSRQGLGSGLGGLRFYHGLFFRGFRGLPVALRGLIGPTYELKIYRRKNGPWVQRKMEQPGTRKSEPFI